MSAVNFYDRGIDKLLDSWSLGNNQLFNRRQVGDFAYWLFIREGLINLGFYHSNAPVARKDFEWFINEDYYVTKCPSCEADAVTVPEQPELGIWCPTHGIIKE